MTARLPITMACWDYDRMRALRDGRVTVEGVDLTYLPLFMPESFFRMQRFGEFQASEMSMGWYTRMIAADQRPPYEAIPVFPSRMFRHSGIYINTGSGIDAPADLQGKRVGVPEYGITAVIWIKGILADHYGVPVNSVTYHTGGLEEPGRREAPFELPADISVTPIGDTDTLSAALARGDLDAVYAPHTPSCYAAGDGRVRRLFEDYPEVERDYFRKTGVFPIMHTLVIRSDVLEHSLWVAQELTKACNQAKALALADLYLSDATKNMLPWQAAWASECSELMGEDFWPYGLEANRKTLETFLRYVHEQHIVDRRIEPAELFVPSTLMTSKI
jgi:4,5-dihydroxyphthalate decarboxylase